MKKTVFIFDLNRVIPKEEAEKLRSELVAQIASGVLLVPDEVTYVEALEAEGYMCGVDFANCELVNPAEPERKPDNGAVFNITRRVGDKINLRELKAAIKAGRGYELIRPGDELEFTLSNGEAVKAVCGKYIGDRRVRFAMKDALAERWVMNKTATNEGGYLKSEGRRHVLEDILPMFPEELRELMEPRPMVEVIDGEKHEYADTLWLPSATDVFGAGEYWDEEPDSVQLDIFKLERERVKEIAGYGSANWWLRSPLASDSSDFVFVSTDGTVNGYDAFYSCGFAPGFDL